MSVFTILLAENLPESEAVKEAVSWFQKMLPALLTFGRKLLFAVLFFIIGRRLIRWLKKVIERSFKRANMEEGVEKFLLSLITIASNIILVVVAISILGVETSSLAAVVGSAGLTIGLALQGSLSNFAGGVLILVMKPFRIGDYIIAGLLEGTVTGIDIFYTRLLTVDNRKVVIPNGGLSNSSIINVTNEENRRLDILVPVAYNCDIHRVKQILGSLVEKQNLVLKEEPVNIFMDSFMDSSISIGIRVWTRKEDYWTLKWELLEQIKEAFDKNGISIPFNQLDININSQSIN